MNAIAPEAVVTFAHADGFVVRRSFGIVRGEASASRNIFASTFRTIGTLIGIANAECLTDAERARGEALERLRESAEAFGANGIVGLAFSARESRDGATHVVATGEAVLLDPPPA